MNGSVTSPSEALSPATKVGFRSVVPDVSRSVIPEPDNELSTPSGSSMVSYDNGF